MGESAIDFIVFFATHSLNDLTALVQAEMLVIGGRPARTRRAVHSPAPGLCTGAFRLGGSSTDRAGATVMRGTPIPESYIK